MAKPPVGFDLPAFNGTVRLMAVAWSDTGVGQASTDVLVRDPVVVQPSLPRFLTPGDTSRMRLELTHATGVAGEMALRVTGHGLGTVPDSVTLADGGRAVLDLALSPHRLGRSCLPRGPDHARGPCPDPRSDVNGATHRPGHRAVVAIRAGPGREFPL